jgi:hypothetical protein
MGCISVQFEAMLPEKLDPAKPRDSIRPVPHIDVGKIRPGSHRRRSLDFPAQVIEYRIGNIRVVAH